MLGRPGVWSRQVLSLSPPLYLPMPWRTKGSHTTSMMTVLVSLKEERKVGALSDGSMVRGIVGLEEVVLVCDPPGLRKMMEMWQ